VCARSGVGPARSRQRSGRSAMRRHRPSRCKVAPPAAVLGSIGKSVLLARKESHSTLCVVAGSGRPVMGSCDGGTIEQSLTCIKPQTARLPLAPQCKELRRPPLVGAERRMAIWLAIYAIALFALVHRHRRCPGRPGPDRGHGGHLLTLLPQQSSRVDVQAPAPAQWQPAITTLRWAGIIQRLGHWHHALGLTIRP